MGFFVLIFLFALQAVQCARILGIFYVPGYSHFVLGETVFKELARRGHEVTMVSAMPQKEPIKNYKDIELRALEEVIEKKRKSSNINDFVHQPAISAIGKIFHVGSVMTELALKDKNVQGLLHSNQTFDLIILEQFVNEAHFGFMHHFKAPLILMCPTRSSLWSNTIMGNPTPYAYVPNLFLDLSPNMTYWQRTWNTVISTFETVIFNLLFLPQHEYILHKYFPDAPPLKYLMQNASLMFLNSHPTIGSSVPLLPNMIEIGGFHVEGQKENNLTDDLQDYLDNAEEGVVYFSMGSNLQSKDMDKEKVQHFLNTFAELDMKVLWKFEEDLPWKPGNVKIEKWFPQPAVLAHKNVKLFMTHGGKLSIIESIYHGKPILAMPMMAEQFSNVEEAVHLGYAVYVSFQTLSEDSLTEALTELLQNPRYTQEAKRRSEALRDLKISPLENAISWIEYVIKHKGAPHLKNPAVYLPWYEYLLLDVVFFLMLTILVVRRLLWNLVPKLFGLISALVAFVVKLINLVVRKLFWNLLSNPFGLKSKKEKQKAN